jgi:acetoin utilization deacetylase AcuC-like enzyme
MKTMEQSGLLQYLTRIQPKKDILQELALIHTAEHLHALESNYKQSNDVALAVVGAILAATDEVCSGRLKNAFCATRPPGHHARNTGRVEGFCFYNGVAIAARYAQENYGFKKILIIDWDYHHGNGTESFFYSDPSVLYFSTHDYYAYPGTGNPVNTGEGAGKGLNINVHLDCHSTDKDIISAFKEKLLPAAHRFEPDLILISAGFDSRKGDLLGCFDISDAGYRQITTMVMQLAEQYCDGRIVSVLEGGYNLDGLASAVKVHVETLQG